MFNRYIQLFNTIKFLKPIQVQYRLYYFARKKLQIALKIKPIFSKESDSKNLNLKESIHIVNCYYKHNRFIFLNREKQFNKIDWNYSEYGKLWTYNLTYFDYLSQKDREDNLDLIYSFIENIEHIKDGLEPFPISLRGINWIKYLSYHKIKDKSIDDNLYAQYYILVNNLEYHLLGNHLLENSFSLLFGAYYFEDERLYQKAKDILVKELKEQILDDGGHFELSPMYHQIMLFRLLDSINLIKNNIWKDDNLLNFLIKKSQLMLGWLDSISYQNGDIPMFNDSSNGIAPTTKQLLSYAKRLNLTIEKKPLLDSGYRKISKDSYESIVDIGEIGASYIPGHAHSDTFNFELRFNGRPFIVDMGLSTYETCDRRTIERSTLSHNTVEVNSKNQSEVWGGFRVGNRANIIELKESENYIKATHNGYKKDDILHTREWIFKEDRVIIKDKLSQPSDAIARFHFHPDITKEEIYNSFGLAQQTFQIKNYELSLGFNLKTEALLLEIKFHDFLLVEILNLKK